MTYETSPVFFFQTDGAAKLQNFAATARGGNVADLLDPRTDLRQRLAPHRLRIHACSQTCAQLRITIDLHIHMHLCICLLFACILVYLL